MKRPILLSLVILIVFGAGILAGFRLWHQGVSDEEYKEAIRNNLKVFSLDLPQNLTFAGEKVPMDLFYVQEAFDRELLTNTYWHSSTLLMLKRAHRFFPVIEPILKKNGIPDDFKYLSLVESNLTNIQSPSNATGYWQFLKETAIHYGLEVNEEVDERYNLEKSTEAACKYLNDNYAQLKNWTLTAAAYNTGLGNIDKPREAQKANNYYEMNLNLETSRYIYRILAVKEIFNDPVKYGYYIRKKDMYPVIPVRMMNVDSSISNLATFARQSGISYKAFKEFNPWLRKNSLTNKKGKVYQISVPNEADLHISHYKNDSI